MSDRESRARDGGGTVPAARSRRGRPSAETARLHAQLSAGGLTDTEIATRLGITPKSLEGALRRHRHATGQTLLDQAEQARLRAELAAWYQKGCPL